MFQETGEFPRVCALSYFKGILSPKKAWVEGENKTISLKTWRQEKPTHASVLIVFLLVLKKWKQFVGKRRALALPALNIPRSSPSFCCPSTEHGPASRLPRDLVLPLYHTTSKSHQDSQTLTPSPPYFLGFYSVEGKKNKPMFPAITIPQHMSSDTTYMTAVSPHTTYTVQKLGLILTLSTWALSPRPPC